MPEVYRNPDVLSRNAVVIGASGGGLEPVRTVINALLQDFQAPVFVVIHTAPDGPGLLSTILDRAGPLRAEARNLKSAAPNLKREIAEFEQRAEALRKLLLEPPPSRPQRSSMRERRLKKHGEKTRR